MGLYDKIFLFMEVNSGYRECIIPLKYYKLFSTLFYSSILLKDSALKSLEISVAQKGAELSEWEERVRRLQEEKIALIKEKQELKKQVDALEEQV